MRDKGLVQVFDGIVCFGGEDWWYHNQAHFDMQIMRRMAQQAPVLYVNSLGFRMPSVKEGNQFVHRVYRKLASMTRPMSVPFAGFHVTSLISVPIWHRPLFAALNVLSLHWQIRKACRAVGLKRPLLWVACPTAFEIIRRMKDVNGDSVIVYQRTDKFEEYSEQTRDYLIEADRWLSNHADLVLYASRVLYEEERGRKAKSLLVSHGVELAHFDANRARLMEQPADLANIKRPIAGFFGDIDETFVDMATVGEAVRALPDVSFVLVGRVAAELGEIRNLSNVHFLGQKPYEQIPQYGAQFDVALMPLKQNRYKYYSSPIKLKEYLALGVPIVSSNFPEATFYNEVVYIAQNRLGFIDGIRKALQGHGVGTVKSRRARVAADTWEQATLRIVESIRRLLGEKQLEASLDSRIRMGDVTAASNS